MNKIIRLTNEELKDLKEIEFNKAIKEFEKILVKYILFAKAKEKSNKPLNTVECISNIEVDIKELKSNDKQ